MKRRQGNLSLFGVALLVAAMLHSCVGGLPPSLARDIRDESDKLAGGRAGRTALTTNGAAGCHAGARFVRRRS